MPCTAKKYEAERGEMVREGEGPDIGERPTLRTVAAALAGWAPLVCREPQQDDRHSRVAQPSIAHPSPWHAGLAGNHPLLPARHCRRLQTM